MAYVPGDRYEGNIVISVDGISDTIGKISKFDVRLHDDIRKKIDEYAKKIQKKAKQYVPVKTGALKRSISIKKYFNGMTAHVFPSDDKIRKAMSSSGKRQTYRHFIEYGTGTRYTKYKHPRYGTFRGAISSGYRYMAKARMDYEDSFETSIRKIIDKKVVI